MRQDTSSTDRTLLLIAGGLLLVLFVWFQWKLLMLAFAGMLLSILLQSLILWIQRRTHIQRRLYAYLTMLGLVLGGLALLGYLLVPRVVSQLSQAITLIPHSVNHLRDSLQKSGMGKHILAMAHRSAHSWEGRVGSLPSHVAEGAADFGVVAIIGFFAALNPARYREGLLSLVPHSQRSRVRAISQDVLTELHAWLLGQLIPMGILGVVTMVGLWILNVPLAFTIGLLSGLMIFVPYVGSVTSGIIAVLLALQRGPHTALLVFLLYCIVHLLEGYILTPLVQKKAARLPPVLTILAQFCLWGFAGILGVAIAAPLAATGLAILSSPHLRSSHLHHRGDDQKDRAPRS